MHSLCCHFSVEAAADKEGKMTAPELTGVPAVGTPAPDFRLTSAQGAEVALQDYRDRRHVILWFSKGLF
jgi:peroxiredoxin